MSVYVGDVGTEVVLDCGINVSAATVRKILVTKPDGEKKEWSAVPDGTNGIKYVINDGDLDLPGEYRLQASIEMVGWKGRGKPCVLTVLE